MRSLLRLVLVIVLTGVLVAGTLVAVSPFAHEVVTANSSVDKDIDLNQLDAFAVRSYVYASDGSLLATLHGPENRSPVSLDRVSAPVVEAILAVEDADFYNHGGVNVKATFRALLENVSAGEVEQGGSTITQQLVKNAFLTSDQKLDRKVEDAALAVRLEQKMTKLAADAGAPDPVRVAKDKILEKYLNTVYFGSGAYGVQAAAETYWGKDVSELGWAEGAMLAAVIAYPDMYDPILHPQTAKKQRQIALDRLVHLNKITAKEASSLGSEPLPVDRCKIADAAASNCGKLQLPEKQGYFAEEVKQQLLNDPSFGLGATYDERYNAVFSGGLRVHTTLIPQAQQWAEEVVTAVTPANDIGVVASLASVEPSTGAVRAMVGGPGFDKFEYNIATHQPGRQTGSSFKTFVLLTALEQGNIPQDSVEGGGRFKNPGGFPNPYPIEGPGGTLTSVTTASSNGAFVRLGQIVGLENVIALAGKLGVTSQLEPVLSMPLGVIDTVPLEMASAASAIPNGGIYQPYYFIEKIEDRTGKVVYEHVANGRRAFSQTTACYAAQILGENTRSGTGTRARLNRQEAAGKTGTTEDHSDAWFVGFTPYLATAVWMGNPQERVPMYRLGGKANFGGTYPAQIWHDFNQRYHDSLTPVPFPRCSTTRGARKVKGLGDQRGLPPGSTTDPSKTTTTTGGPKPEGPPPDDGGGGEPPPPVTEPPTSAPPPSSAPPTTPPPGGGGGGPPGPGGP